MDDLTFPHTFKCQNCGREQVFNLEPDEYKDLLKGEGWQASCWNPGHFIDVRKENEVLG